MNDGILTWKHKNSRKEFDVFLVQNNARYLCITIIFLFPSAIFDKSMSEHEFQLCDGFVRQN